MLRYDITLNSRHINSDCAAKTLPQETFRFTCAQNKVSGFIWNNQKNCISPSNLIVLIQREHFHNNLIIIKYT